MFTMNSLLFVVDHSLFARALSGLPSTDKENAENKSSHTREIVVIQ